MNSDIIVAAIWIKYRLDILVKADGGVLQSPVGSYSYSRNSENSLILTGPGINEEITSETAALVEKLVEFSVSHGDSIVSLPRDVREKRIAQVSEEFQVSSDLTKTALSWAHTISG